MDLRDEVIEKGWNSRKIEDETKKPRIFSMNLRNKELIIWMNKNKNYVMLILHQFKLMTIHGFGILLILEERIKIDIAPT